MNITQQADTVVVGAGIIGTTIAEQLQHEGRSVILLDRAEPGAACSSGNAGHFATDVVLPLANLQTIAALPRMLLDRNGPLSLRWSYLPRMLPWLTRFALAALPANARRSARALRELNSRSIADFEQLLTRTGLRELMVQRGAITVYESESGQRKHATTVATLREYGVNLEPLSAAQARELEPALGADIRGGLLFPDTAHTVNPLRLVQALARWFVHAGGDIQQAEVVQIKPLPAGGASVGLHDGRVIDAARVVLAAGAWSGKLAVALGSPVPLDTERGYHLMLPNPQLALTRPITSQERSFVMTPMEHGLRLAGTVELAGLDAAPDYSRADCLFEHASSLLPGLQGEGASRWMGCRPSLPDSLPVIGPSPLHPGVLFAFGHQHLGLTQAATTANIVAGLVAGRQPEFEISPYRVDRFR